MSHYASSVTCPQCHQPLPADAPEDLCPVCLMAMASLATDQDMDTQRLTQPDFPELPEIAAAFPELEIMEKIGQGGMGVVFKARQPRLGRLVALKILPKALALMPGFPERFTREGQVLARLHHPNIVSLYDFGEKAGFCYLLMEYVNGVNLRQALRAERFAPEQALKVVPEICTALQYAHDQGVLHRDIKPENLLLNTQGRIKIADFGIAKLTDDVGHDALLTQSGAKLGTAPYMAPEQIVKPALVDHRADIYSLGVVLYEMLTGELPLGRFAPPSEKAAVGGNVDTVVFRALENDRERRQQSAGEFKTQVEELSHEKVETRVPNKKSKKRESFEYKSSRQIFGMPWLHVTWGDDPSTGKRRVARGFIACGDIAVGILAFGGYARGFLACGGCAVGVIAVGGVGIGLLSWSGIALALLLAIGGLAVAPVSLGGVAVGWQALGGLAVGWEAIGTQVLAHQGFGQNVYATVVCYKITEMSPLLQALVRLSPWMGIGAVLWLPVILPMMLLPWWARARVEKQSSPSPSGSTTKFWPWAAAGVIIIGGALLFKVWQMTSDLAGVQLLVPTAIVVLGLVAQVISLPLLRNEVPPTSRYGSNWNAAWRKPEAWYDIHHYAGAQIRLWGLLALVTGFAGFFQLPMHQRVYPWAAPTLLLITLAATFAFVFGRTCSWSVEGRSPVRLSPWLRALSNWPIALLLLLFFRTFLLMTVRVPEGSGADVPAHSAWIVSRLNVDITPGSLIVFEHESGQRKVARVVAPEIHGLRLKRGDNSADFIIPWDKLIGKMLFPYLSPATQQESPSPPSVPVHHVPVLGTANALDEAPKIRFMRLQLNNKEWQKPLYDVEGKAVPNEISEPLIQASSESTARSENLNTCWLQIWLEHPDFDRLSNLELSVTDLDGNRLPNRQTMIAGPSSGLGRLTPPLQCLVISPGQVGELPESIRMTLKYDIGPWLKRSDTIPVDKSHGLIIGDDWMLADVGQSSDGDTFISWFNNKFDVAYDAVAVLRSGQEMSRSGRSRRGGTTRFFDSKHSSNPMLETLNFSVPLSEVSVFQIRHRKVKTVTFDKVVLPPLP